MRDTEINKQVDTARLILDREDLSRFFEKCLFQYWDRDDMRAVKEKIILGAFQQAHCSIIALDLTAAPNWFVWACGDWGTKSNACRFQVLADEPGCYKFTFYTDCTPPIPVWEKMGEIFSILDFDLFAAEPTMDFAFRRNDPGRQVRVAET